MKEQSYIIKKGDSFEGIFLNYIATEQLLQELLEIDDYVFDINSKTL